jgi:hypothetical protein
MQFLELFQISSRPSQSSRRASQSSGRSPPELTQTSTASPCCQSCRATFLIFVGTSFAGPSLPSPFLAIPEPLLEGIRVISSTAPVHQMKPNRIHPPIHRIKWSPRDPKFGLMTLSLFIGVLQSAAWLETL